MKVHELLNESTENQPSQEWKNKLVKFAKQVVADSKKLVGLEVTYIPEEGDAVHAKVTKVDFFSNYHTWAEYKGTKKFFDPEEYNKGYFDKDGAVQKGYGIVLTLSDGTFLSLGGTVDTAGNGFEDCRFTATIYSTYPDIKNYGSGEMISSGAMNKASKGNATWAQIVQKIYPVLKAKLETSLAVAAAKKRHAAKK